MWVIKFRDATTDEVVLFSRCVCVPIVPRVGEKVRLKGKLWVTQCVTYDIDTSFIFVDLGDGS